MKLSKSIASSTFLADCALAGLSGLLTALAAPPVGWWPLAWVSVSGLWWLCQRQPSIRRAAVYGLCWGLGFYGVVLSWITHLHPLTWMGVPWLASVAIAAFAWAFVTAWGTAGTVVWCAVMARLRRLPNSGNTLPPWLTRLVIGVALWCLLETLRSLTPLDWAPLGLTQSPHNLVALHLGRISGPTAVSALMVAVNGLMAEGILRGAGRWRWSETGPNRSSQPHRPAPLLLAAVLVCMGGHLLGFALYSQPLNDADSLTLGLIQGNIPTREKLTPTGVRQAYSRYLGGYRSLTAQGAAAVLTPEGAIPEIWTPASPFVAAVAAVGAPLWLGTFVPVEPGTHRLTQSLIQLSPNGQISSRYNKVKLVPLGEYLPLEPLLGRLISRLSPLDSYLMPGQTSQRFITPWGAAIVGICYESAYSRLFRQQAAAGGRLILTTSNNDPYPPAMMWQHHALDIMRAIETDRWALRTTNTGISGVVDAHGHTLWHSQPNTYTQHLATLSLRSQRTPYVRWGDWLLGLLGVAAVAAYLHRSA